MAWCWRSPDRVDFLIGMFSITCFFLVGVSSVYKRIKEEGGGCARGERAGSGSQEEGEEATGSDREDRRRGRRHKRRHNPDADREGPIAGKEGGRDIEKKGVVGSE